MVDWAIILIGSFLIFIGLLKLFDYRKGGQISKWLIALILFNLFFGSWLFASGLTHEEYNPEIHVCDDWQWKGDYERGRFDGCRSQCFKLIDNSKEGAGCLDDCLDREQLQECVDYRGKRNE